MSQVILEETKINPPNMWPENRFFHSEGSDPYLAPLCAPGGQGRVFFHWSQHFSIGQVCFQEKKGGWKFDLFAHKKYVYFKHEFLGLTKFGEENIFLNFQIWQKKDLC